MYVCVCVCVCVRLLAWQVELVLLPLPLAVPGLGQAWHRYFCQFKKVGKKLRQMKLIPIGHHGLVSKLTSNGRREEFIQKARRNTKRRRVREGGLLLEGWVVTACNRSVDL